MDSPSSKDNIANGVGAGLGLTGVDEFLMIGSLFLDQKMGTSQRVERRVARSQEYDSMLDEEDVSSQCLFVE
jgi:hypothetical protein